MWRAPRGSQTVSARRTPEDYHALAAAKRYTWLGPEVTSVVSPTRWRCPCGNVFEKSYNRLQNKQAKGCKVCNKMVRKVRADYLKLATRKGLTWLGTDAPRSVHAKTTWQCANGHPPFEADYHTLNRRHTNGCAHCSGKARKKASDYRDLAANKSLTWLGRRVPRNVVEKTEWQCSHQHPPFRVCYSHLANYKHNGCRRCMGSIIRTAADYRALAKRRGLLWVSSVPPRNTGTPTEWQCLMCGHVWPASYNNIDVNKSGCPKCVDMEDGYRVSRQQRAVGRMLQGRLNVPVGRYIVDVVTRVQGTDIAVEYDSWYWHAGRMAEDALRDGELVAAGWRLLRIRSNTKTPTKVQLERAIDTLLAGKPTADIVLDDWGAGTPARHMRSTRPRRPPADRHADERTIEIDAEAKDCVGELDRRMLYVRRAGRDLQRLKLQPSEARVLGHALKLLQGEGRGHDPVIVKFSHDTVRDALGRSEWSVGSTRTMASRLRLRARFVKGEEERLLRGMSKGHYSTTIPICMRPEERTQASIQTDYGEWRPFGEAREFVRQLGLKRQIDWFRYSKGQMPEAGTRPRDIPSNPQRVYRDAGWDGWPDWLGYGDGLQG